LHHGDTEDTERDDELNRQDAKDAKRDHDN